MELIDIINENDEVVWCASRKEIYDLKYPHRIVHVLLFDWAWNLILQKRSRSVSFFPQAWSTSVWGHVLSWENYEEAALREFEEELWVKDVPIDFLWNFDFLTDTWILKKITVFKSNYSGDFDVNPFEVEKVESFSLSEIQKMVDVWEKFHPELLFLIKKLLQW